MKLTPIPNPKKKEKEKNDSLDREIRGSMRLTLTKKPSHGG